MCSNCGGEWQFIERKCRKVYLHIHRMVRKHTHSQYIHIYTYADVQKWSFGMVWQCAIVKATFEPQKINFEIYTYRQDTGGGSGGNRPRAGGGTTIPNPARLLLTMEM